MEEFTRSNIFEKFYRIGNEDTRRTKGTGLVLYIVRQIVKAHKGNITIKSNQPTGRSAIGTDLLVSRRECAKEQDYEPYIVSRALLTMATLEG